MSKLKSTYFTNHSQAISVFKLVNVFFWKSLIGPLIAILLPVLFMVIYKIIDADQGSQSSIFGNGLPTYITFSILPISLVTFPQMIVEFKSSIILRKISISKITPLKCVSIFLGYYLCILVGIVVIIFLLFTILLNKDAPAFYKKIRFGQCIYGIVNVFIVSLAVGLLCGVLIKKNHYVQMIGFSILLLSVTLAGQFIPITVIGTSEAIKYISLFSPISYSLNLLNNSLINDADYSSILGQSSNPIDPELAKQLAEFMKTHNTGNNIFDLHHDFQIFNFITKKDAKPQDFFITIYQSWQKVLNLIMSYIFAAIFFGIGIKKFNWTSR